MIFLGEDLNNFMNHNITIYVEPNGNIILSDFPEEFMDLALKLTNKKKLISTNKSKII